MGRAPCCDKGSVKKGPWSPEEDRKLKDYIHKHGTGGNWIALPAKAGLKRCGKSCRLRWLNYLRPNIKHGGFSDEEDRVICSLYASIGSRWSVIAAQLPGRTDNDIKNYWNTKLKKKLLNIMSHSQIRPSKEPPAAANVGTGVTGPGGADDPPLALFSQLLLDQHYHSSSIMFGIGGDHHQHYQQQQMAPSSSVFLSDFDLVSRSSGSGSDGLEQGSIFAGLQLQQQQEELPADNGMIASGLMMPQLDHHPHHHRLYGSSYEEDQHEMKPLVIAPSTGSFLYAATATPGTRYQY